MTDAQNVSNEHLTNIEQMVEHPIAAIQRCDVQRIRAHVTFLTQSSLMFRLKGITIIRRRATRLDTYENLRRIDVIDERRVVKRCFAPFTTEVDLFWTFDHQQLNANRFSPPGYHPIYFRDRRQRLTHAPITVNVIRVEGMLVHGRRSARDGSDILVAL